MMLTDAQRAIVKATVPLLETGGEALTTHFYKVMLAEYPWFVRCSTRRTRPAAINRALWPTAC